MNKLFSIKCSEFLPELDYVPCKEYEEMKNKRLIYNIKYRKSILNKNSKNIKTSNSKKYKKLLQQCIKYKKSFKKRRCNLEEYINFSGAEPK
jgi:DNA-binding transcriptional regulator YhcF (GntR family)